MRSTLIPVLGTFLIASIIHFSYIRWIGGSLYIAENQDVENTVKIEEYLYDDASFGMNLIVGTSLSAHVQHPDLLNLSFKGGSPLTILEILGSATQLPEKVLLESNFLYYPVDHEAVERFQSGKAVFLPMMQDRYRPMSLLLGAIKGQKNQFDELPKIPTQSMIAPEIKAKKLENQVAGLANKLGGDEVEIAISQMRKAIERLENRGVEIVFFESPFDSEVSSQPRQVQWRKILAEEFPNHRVNHLAINETATSDGIHLCLEGVLEMGEQLGLLAGKGARNP